MIYLRWLFLTLIDYAILLPPVWLAPIIGSEWWMVLPPFHTLAIVVSLFTRNGWGSITQYFGTPDNPPKGNQGFIGKSCLFPYALEGFKGYANRVWWLWRNPNYYYQKMAGVKFNKDTKLYVYGNQNISDKKGVAGSYFAKARSDGKLIAFELYAITPHIKGKCLRVRLGWKIASNRALETREAPLVNTVSPFMSFGAKIDHKKG